MAITPGDDGGGAAQTLELKGRMATLTVVRVHSADIGLLSKELEQKLREAPNLLRGAPMLIELAEEVDPGSLSLQHLASAMRELGAVPVAVRGNGVDESMARGVGLGILNAEVNPQRRGGQQAAELSRAPEADKGNQGEDVRNPEEVTASRGKAASSERCGNKPRVIDHPVRSGQQVYARGRDIVVLGAVGTGAEILADGDVHIYGALRGRALAGVQGDLQARIFCMALDAELVSVAGNYQVSERFEAEVRGKPAHISLDESGTLRIDPFGKSA